MKKIDEISTRLKIAKKNLDKYSPISSNSNNSSFGSAVKLSTELVAAVVVGSIIGFILDIFFGTKPWLIIIFFFLGSIAGIMNVIRSASLMNKKRK